MPARSHDILCDFLGRRQTSATTATRKSSARSAGTVTKAAADNLFAAARAVLATSPVTKDATPAPAVAPPRSGPRYVERAPATPRAESGSVQAVVQAAVREVPEPDGASSLAAAFDGARAKREDGRYGVPVSGGTRS
jgi:hypothetical protein